MRTLSTSGLLALGLAVAILSGCERPPPDSVQSGFRGTAMQQVYNPRILAAQAEANKAPEVIPAVSSEGPKAKDVYQNVQVLGNLSVGEFTRLMTAMTAWVSPQEGCTYCHNPANFAEDSKYTKVVARRMTEMTQTINADWKTHVAATGVTCYTCHRGNPVPQNVWFAPLEQKHAKRMLGNKAQQNTPAESVTLATLPYDPFTPFLLQDQQIAVNGTTALPTGNRQSIKQTEWTFGLMVHMSDSLGVNCTYCHNTRAISEWKESPPQRTTAWHGIRMARDLNKAYLEPLTPVFPPNRLGPTGDVAKVNCSTCHQGAYKPLYGAPMAKDHPELQDRNYGAPPAAPAPIAAAAMDPQAKPAQ